MTLEGLNHIIEDAESDWHRRVSSWMLDGGPIPESRSRAVARAVVLALAPDIELSGWAHVETDAGIVAARRRQRALIAEAREGNDQ